MLIAHLDPLAAALFSLLAIGCLVLDFVMLGSRWLRDYMLAFAAQSWLIAVLSAAVDRSSLPWNTSTGFIIRIGNRSRYRMEKTLMICSTTLALMTSVPWWTR